VNYRYVLERAEPRTVSHASYTRLAAPVLHSYHWRGMALSDDLDALREIADRGENMRIIDRRTGEEVYRSDSCPIVY